MHLVKDRQSIKFSSLGNGAAQGHHFLEETPRGMLEIYNIYLTLHTFMLCYVLMLCHMSHVEVSHAIPKGYLQ